METTVASMQNDTGLPSSRENRANYEAEIVLSAFITILGIWCAMGNTLTILAISFNREMKTKGNYFIFSLAISDLISGVIVSPMWLYRRTWGYEEWLLGDFLCKFSWFVSKTTMYCTTWHIAGFAVLRYIAIKWPLLPAKISNRKVKYLITGIWLMAIVLGGTVLSTFYGVEREDERDKKFVKLPSCSIRTAENGIEKHEIYFTFSSICFMLIPMGVLILSSILIAKELFGSANKTPSRIKKERKAVVQLALVSASFLLGYIPDFCFVMWTTHTDNKDYKIDYWMQVATYFCLRISECLNPIIYNATSSRMRNASKKVLHYIRNCGRSDAELEMSMQVSGTTQARQL